MCLGSLKSHKMYIYGIDICFLICSLIDSGWLEVEESQSSSRPFTRPANSPWNHLDPAADQSSLSAWRKLWSLATHWAHCEDSDQTGRMPRLIWVFAGRTLIMLVLSCRGSHIAGFYTDNFFSTRYFVSMPLKYLEPAQQSYVASRWTIALPTELKISI